MKYVVILGDGMADWQVEELGGKTPLSCADTPMLDELAVVSQIGMVKTIPDGMAPGSDTANLSVMGYNPEKYYTGRSPLEALSIGISMKDTDVVYRCNLVTLSEEDKPYEAQTMVDHSSDEIRTEDAGILLKAVADVLTEKGYSFYRGTSYRHCMVWDEGKICELTPPHDILTKTVGEYLPKDEILLKMQKESYEILKNHPINLKRKEQGLNPANSFWFWGAGTKPALDSFEEIYHKKGVMISAVDLLKGIAAGAKMDRVEVEGATGGLHTNYEGKAEACVKALTEDGYDFAYVHVEAPDEMGHQGNVDNKLQAISNVDKLVLGTVLKGLREVKEDFRVMVLPDHPTPIEVRTHTGEPIPYLLYDSTKEVKGADGYNEKTARAVSRYWPDGYKLISHLLQNDTEA